MYKFLKFSIFLILLSMSLMTFGCATSKMKTPVIDPRTNKVLLDQNGQPIMQELDITDNGSYYRAVSKRELAKYLALSKKYEADKERYSNPAYNEVQTVDPETGKITTIKFYVPNGAAEVSSAVVGLTAFGGFGGNSNNSIRPPAPHPAWGIAGSLIRAAASVVTFGLIANSVENIVSEVAKNSGTHINMGNFENNSGSPLRINTGNGNNINDILLSGQDERALIQKSDTGPISNNWTEDRSTQTTSTTTTN